MAPDPKACLLVTNIFPPAVGGSSQVYAALASCAHGDIVVLTSSHDHETGLERERWRQSDQHAAYPVHRLTCVRPFLRKLFPRSGFLYRLHEAATAVKLAVTVMRLAHRYRVAAICIADDETVGWLAGPAKYVLRRHTLIYCHGDDLTFANARAPQRARWFGLADKVVAASHYAGRLLAERFGVPAAKISVIQNGVDLSVFHPQPVSASFLQQHGLEGRRVLLTVTRLVPRKGVDKVLEALPAIAGKFSNVLYVVAGDGPQRQELERRAQALGIGHLVRFVGAVEHAGTRAFYDTAELVLLPNREEAGEADGLPLVFLEANACAKPVIGGKAGGTAEVVRDGENGFVVDGGDVGAIEAAVCQLLGDEDRRIAMGRKGFEMVQGCGWQERAQAFLRLCREA